ncbi:MAG: NUDIX domain-containing protein [Phycisphaerales bacterium]|nr:NUDIX domain-containing protein [Phycisphaerales bacterium]
MPKEPHIEIIARGLFIHDNRVLLCKNLELGYHYLPGGHVEFTERASESLQRELLEECSLESAIGPLLLTTEQVFATKKKTHHEINLVFHVEHIGKPGEVQTSVVSNEPEIGFVWIDLAAITEIDLRPIEIQAWLASGGGVSPTTGPLLTGIDDSLQKID